MSRRAVRLPRALLASAFVAFGGVAFAGDTLTLHRSTSRVNHGSLDFYLHGAVAGDPVVFKVVVDPNDDLELRSNPEYDSKPSDRAGNAFCHLDVSQLAGLDDDRPLYLRAYTVRSDGRGWVSSNAVAVHEPALLHLVVADADATARALVFDPVERALVDGRSARVDADSPIAATDGAPIGTLDGVLRRLDGAESVTLVSGERPIDVAVTPDQSTAVALTRESIAGGRELLRLRVLDAAHLHELGNLEVLRSASHVVKAWLVVGDDSHRVLVVERDGIVREVMLGAEPTRGVTLLPMAPDGSDELVDVRVVDDRLVALTRRSVARGRKPIESRLVVLDLHARDGASEFPIAGRALALEVAARGERPTAFVALAEGRIEALDLDGTNRATVELPGVARLVSSPTADRLYALTVDPTGRLAVALVDSETLQTATLRLPSIVEPASSEPTIVGVLATPKRQWLYLVERRDDGEDRLRCFELDPASGRLARSSAPVDLPLGGKVVATAH